MAVDPWAEEGSQPGGGGGYLSDADFRRAMDATFGPGKWRETGGYRSQAREAALRAQGALTVAPGHTSAHSRGEEDAPGAHDVVVDGLTPEQTAAKIKAYAPDLFSNIYPEAKHGTQGAHLHLGVKDGTQGGDPWSEAPAPSADPWAPAPVAPEKKPESFLEKTERVGASLLGGAVSGAGKLLHGIGELGDVYAQSKAQEAAVTGQISGPMGGSSPVPEGVRPEFGKIAQERQPVVSTITDPWAESVEAAGDQIAPTNRSGLESFAHGAGEIVPALGAAVVNPLLGGVAFGAQGYGEAHDEALTKGVDEGTAQTAGLENAAVQGGLGILPVGELTAPLAAAKEGLIGLGARLGLNVVGDASLGAAMQTGSNLVAKQNYDPTRAWYDQVPESAAMMAAGGLVIHGTHEAIGGGAKLLRRPEAPVTEPGSQPVTGPTAPDEMPATNAIRAYAGKGPVEAEAPPERAEEPSTWTPEREAAFQAAQAAKTAPIPDGDAVMFNTDHGPVHGTVEESAPSVDGKPGDLVVKTPAGRARVPRSQAVPLPQDYEAARVATGAPLEQMPQAISDTQELRLAAPKGYNLFNAIRDLGGIKTRDTDGAPNDVAAIIDKAKPQPGVINNKSGMSPDGMREALKERGWFGAVDEETAQARDSVQAPGSTLDELHDLIRQQVAGGKEKPVFHPETREQEARRGDLEEQMQRAGVGLTTPLPEAAAKLAAWRGEQVKTHTADMELLRKRAEDLGVKLHDDATYDEALADVVEREAIQGEATAADADRYEGLIDAELTPEEHEWLTAGPRGAESELGPSFEPEAPPSYEPEPGAQEGGGEPRADAGGGGEDQAAGGAPQDDLNPPFAPHPSYGTVDHWNEFARSYTNIGTPKRYEQLYGVKPPPGAKTDHQIPAETKSGREKFDAIKAQNATWRAEAETLATKGEPVRMEHADGRTRLVGPDINHPGKFRSTAFDKGGEPWGHEEYDTLEEAIYDELLSGFLPKVVAPRKRLYPSYTTEDLKARLTTADAATRAKMQGEIDAREAGLSVARVTPQVPPRRPSVERQDIGGETVQQQLLAGGERSARQAAAAREGALKPKVAQEKPGGLFGEPEPVHGSLFAEHDPWSETRSETAPKDIAPTPEAVEAQARAETPPGSGYGEKNQLFTKEAADAARAKLNAMMRSQLNSGIDPEMVHAGITLAGYHVEAGARKFGDFAHAMIRDLGEWSAPWLRMWYNALRDYPGFDNEGMTPHDKLSESAIEEALADVRRHSEDLEPGGGDAAAADADGAGALPAGSVEAERGLGSAGNGAAAAGDRAEGGDGLPDGGAAPVGEGRPGGLFEDPSWKPGQPAEPGEPGGGDLPRDEGIQPGRIPAADLERVADEAAHLEPVAAEAHPYAESTNAPPVSHELEAALPTLFPEQRADVAFAEQRFETPEGHGVLFTNGTGTGKTFTGGGIVKRMFDRDQKRVLVVAPTQGILNHWRETMEVLKVPFHVLEGIDDKGPTDRPVGTTYANLANNRTLADRPWDAVVADEAHTLSSDQFGSETEALKAFRALTNHPDRLRHKAEMQLRKDVDRVAALRALIPKGAVSGPAHDKWLEAQSALDEKIAEKVAEFKGEPRGKAVFLSATPFAYDKSIEYAHGYLFDYGPEPQGRGYNTGSAKDQFFMRHFGYRMRYGKLTKPEAAVESDVMERQFHEWLRRTGALSGRVLNVDKDYDRKFVTIDDAVGNKIDQALEFLNNADEGKFRPFAEVVRKRFDYLSRARLLEAIKAKHAIPRIRQHLALGRKVVVFHNYNEGGGFNPFRDLENVVFRDEEPGYAKALHAEFLARNPYVADLEEGMRGLPAPLIQLRQAFPDALVYNGTVPKAVRERAKQDFNKDGGPHNLIIVQSEAGQAGISLHDTTGKHQRVIENLGLPGRPVAAIQQEGRIYRIGQASDAIFRYLNTGTNWERHAFASTIAQRAGTAENLALGAQSRTLRDSFINAYLDSAPNPPARGEGVGGKKADFELAKALTDYQKAKSFYFAEAKKGGRRDQREGKDYYATPEPVGLKMVEWADIRPGDKVLEPSAGHGAIARFFPDTADRTIVEPSAHLASRAALSSPGAHVIEQRFEDLHAVNKYDAIVMNPPFGHAGATAIDHIAKAANHLRDGGRIVALIPRGATDGKFETFMESPAAKGIYQVADIHLPPATFERAGTKVATRIVVLERHNDAADSQRMQEVKHREYSNAANITELFDRLEDATLPQRVISTAPDVPEVSPAQEKLAAKILESGNRAFDTGETLHGKTGEPLFVATAKDRMVSDEYKAVLQLAKKHGGFYSSFRGKGAIPGFQFKSEAQRAAFMHEATSTSEGKFSAPPIFYSAVEKHVADSPTKAAPADQWKAMLKNAPGIRQEELQWTGVGDWLDLFPKGEKVPKEKLQAFLRDNGVHVDEVVTGSQPGNRALEARVQERAQEIYDEMVAEEVARLEERPGFEHETEEGLQEIARDRVEWDEADERARNELIPETQYADWKLPGGSNYRELLLTLPKEANPPATHWDTPGVMAHVRFDERQSPDGKRVLFVEEVQSDWHQKGRDHGYARHGTPEEIADADRAYARSVEGARAANEEVRRLAKDLGHESNGSIDGAQAYLQAAAGGEDRFSPEQREQAHRAVQGRQDAELRAREALIAYEIAKGKGGIPDAPFKTSWPALVMKRVIRWAVDNGFERVAWTTGEQQAERYNLGHRLGTLHVTKTPEGYHVSAEDEGVNRAIHNASGKAGSTPVYSPAELREAFGREIAEHITAKADAAPADTTSFQPRPGTSETVAIDMAGQRIGGEGMSAFYDRNLVNITNDLIKKHGGKVESFDMRDSSKFWRDNPDLAVLPKEELVAKFREAMASGNHAEINRLHAANDHRAADTGDVAPRTDIQHGFDITPKLAEHVAGGQPLFKRASTAREPGQTESRVRLPGDPRGIEMRRYDNPTQAQAALIDHVEAVIRKIVPFADVLEASSIRMTESQSGYTGHLHGMAYRSGLRHIIAWSLQGRDVQTGRHEAVHVLRQAGLFTGDEWTALERAATNDGWLEQFQIPQRYGEVPFAGQVEEAIADKFAEWKEAGRRGLDGPIRTAFNKLAKALEQVREVARRFLGLNPDFRDVFARMERGEVGQRFGEDIRDTTGEPPKFSVPGKSKEPERVGGFFNRMLGRNADAVGRKLAAAAAKAVPDPLLDLADQVKMGASPMGSGSTRAQAAAKDFANELRTSAYQWSKVDEWLNKHFPVERQKIMWEAADEEGVLIRRGVAPGPNEGLNRLSDKERAAVLNLQERADAAFEQAQNLGMVRGDGLESYVPRMVVEMTAGGPRIVSSAGPRAARKGANLSTTTGQLRQRKYETVEETEAAAREHFGEKATVVRNIRTLALATQRLERAVAGRILVEKIKAMSKDAQAALVVSGGRPDTSAFFTLEHPALQQWRPKFIREESTGKTVAAQDQNGETIFEAHPVWVAREFEGPLKAVLSSPSNGVVRALMDLKGKMMSVIMYSPLMHNAVIWGKAIPADPRGVLTFQAYRRGSVAKADAAVMEEAMRAGLDPIGRRFFNQDITSIAEGAQIVPGRSWTSQLLAYVPGLFDPKAGEAVKAAVDKAGDVWHNTFLWDRVGDLQMGLYVHVRDQLMRHSNESGIGPRDAQRIAAHFANRYAGSLPMESMSKLSRETANLLLFSRSFTLGNLAAYKDIVKGLPSDVRAQVLRDSGAEALERVQGAARQKAISMMVLDVGLSYVGLFMAAAMSAWLTGQKMQAPWDNEPDREKRFLIGYQPDGTAVYGRLPTGKVGEELQDWLTEPRDILLRKLSPYAKLAYGLAANDKGFGRKIYMPDDPLLKNAARVTWYAMQSIAPVGQLQGAKDAIDGSQDRKTATLQALAPIAGVTISKGAPGGPMMAEYYRAKDAHDFAVQEALPDIRRQIVRGDIAGAREKMKALGIAPGLQNFYVRTARNPGGRLSGRAMRDFNQFASPEQRAALSRARAEAAARAQDDATP